MNYLSAIGKTLDQPLLVSRFSKAVPSVLIGGAAAYGLYDTYKAPEKDRKKSFVKNLSVLGFTVNSALIATRGLKVFGKKLIPGLQEIKTPQETIKKSERILNRFKRMLEKSSILNEETRFIFKNPRVNELLEKMVKSPLNPKEINELQNTIGKNKWGEKLLRKLIPDPENISSKKIFKEIKRLSLLGLVPVAGGIAGGITGDFLTEKDWKKRVPDKINEGTYQYLANIFLCNVGAGAALAIMEKMNIKSKAARAAGMTAGIVLTGVIGGSAIANYLCKKCTDLISCKDKGKQEKANTYTERKPEALDVGLHLDDIATVAVMSGLKWIEPALPILYSVSGYRAGIGYRNGEKCACKEKNPFDHKPASFKSANNNPQVFIKTNEELFKKFNQHNQKKA